MKINKKYEEERLKKFKAIIEIENYKLCLKDDEIVVVGSYLTPYHELNILFCTYEIKKMMKEDSFEDIEFDDNELLYTVGVCTQENLYKFKYTDTLNIITMWFKEKKNALLMLTLLETMRYAKQQGMKIPEIIDYILKENQSKTE